MNPARGSYEQSLPYHVTAQGLPAHYKAVRQRLMKRERDFLVVPPTDDISPANAESKSVRDMATQQRLTQAQQILAEIAQKHGVRISEIRGPRRQRALVLARHEYCVRLYSEMPQLSLPSIGRIINRDHTTVLYAVRKHKEAMEQ